MKSSSSALVILVFLMASCAGIKKSGSTVDAYENYQEDLTESLIQFPDLAELSKKSEVETPKEGSLAVDEDLEFSINKWRENYSAERYWSGFTVLVYSGVDRDQAFKTRNDLYTYFPDMKSDMQYQQPRYLVKIGKFINRIEAQPYYHQLKEFFPSARIIQDRFQREGYVNPEPIEDGQRQN
ncbi:hypothetical protein EF405_14635 [Cyclobacteriaceae bacterium YHN15]|jgi:hypothetical protein|nr:hypothetical protein EF405_14635 [Cyclobacteriaceae bacterium YHN15]